MIGVTHVEDARPAGGAARKLDRGLDAFGAGVREERLVEIRHVGEQPLGEDARERRDVHLHEVRKIAVQHAFQRVTQHRMVAADREHTEAGQQVEIALVLAVVEVLALAALEADVETDGLEHPDELLVQVAGMQRPALGFAFLDHPRQVQLSTRHCSHFCFVVTSHK